MFGLGRCVRSYPLSAIAGVVVLAALAPPAAAQESRFHPWDGRPVFRCDFQDVGRGVDYPNPDADPFCVEYDKTQQNVLPDLGVVEFLSREPARFAAAGPKCFYFQRDHWSGWVLQGAAPELWHWDGNYFFDKARGMGGVSFHSFRAGGQAMDGSEYAPEPFAPYLYEGGGGGGYMRSDYPVDPACTERVDTPEERRRIYRKRWR